MLMYHLEVKYINLASHYLRNFCKKQNTLYNFSCFYCGDSKKNTRKARGFLFLKNGKFIFKCHNCGIGKTFSGLLQDINPNLYDDFIMDNYKEKIGQKEPETVFDFSKPIFSKKSSGIFSSLKTIDKLIPNHVAKQYLLGRKIPESYFSQIYYCKNFGFWDNLNRDKESENLLDPRIVFPLYGENNKLLGYQGRSILPNTRLRYLTTMLSDSFPKIYGLNTINKSSRVCITEGIIDSLFLKNSLAMLGSDFNLDNLIPKENVAVIYDNEKRNPQIFNKYQKSIEKGYNVLIYPNHIKGKDINEIIINDECNIDLLLKHNVYSGIEAKIKLSSWKNS